MSAPAEIPLCTLWVHYLQDALEKRRPWTEAALESEMRYHSETVDPDTDERPTSTNKSFAATRTRMATILRSRVQSRFKAIEGSDEQKARVAQTLANWTLYVNRFSEKTWSEAYWGCVTGVGISYVAWKFPLAAVEQGTDQNAEVVAGNATEKKRTPEDSPERDAALARAFPNALIGKEIAFIEVLPPYDFLLDPQAVGPTALEDARWTAHRYWKTKREFLDLQESGFFDKEIELQYDPLEKPSAPNAAMPNLADNTGKILSGEHDLDTLWEGWQIHDKTSGMVLHVLPGTAEPIRRRKNTLGMPYQDFRPDQTPDRFWNRSLIWQVEPLQKMIDKAQTDKVEYASRLSKPLVLLPDSAGDDLATKLAEAEPGEFINVPDDVLLKMKVVEMYQQPTTLNPLITELGQGHTETTGASEVSSGVLTRPQTTATEAGISAQFQNTRAGMDRKWYSAWLRQVVMRVDFLNQKFFTQAKAIPILGLLTQHFRSADDQQTVDLTAADIKGTFDYEIHAGEDSEAVRAEEKKFIMDFLSVATLWMQTGFLDPMYVWSFVGFRLDMDPTQLIRKGAGMAQVPPVSGGGGQTPSLGRGPSEGNAPTPGKAPQATPDVNRTRMPTDGAQHSAAMRG